MNKKVWIGFVAVFVTLEVLDFLIHGVILAPTYASLQSLWRPNMNDLMWVMHIVSIIGSFFFAFIFSKGYEGKGLTEGLRYGLYIGLWMSTGFAYGTYAMIAIPYSLALQWFLYGIVEYVIAGGVLAMVFASGAKQQTKMEGA